MSATLSSNDVARSLVDFTASIASASTLEELDRSYLDAVRRFVPTRRAGYYLLDPFTHGAEHIATIGVSDYFLARYEEAGRQRDPVLARVFDRQRPVLNRHLMSGDAWRALDVYGDVFSLHQMTVLLEAPVFDGGSIVGTLNFGDDDEGAPLSQEQIDLAGAIGRLLGVALHSIRERGQLERERDHVVAALELCDDAVIVTDLRQGRRRENSAARRLLNRVKGASTEGWLDEVMSDQRREDDVMVVKARVGLVAGGEAVLRVHSIETAVDPTLVVSFLTLCEPCPRRVLHVVEHALTARERDVAEHVVRGLHDAEIAECLLLSPHTVKGYLKSVYRKLGVRSRVDLTALLLQGSGENGRG